MVDAGPGPMYEEKMRVSPPPPPPPPGLKHLDSNCYLAFSCRPLGTLVKVPSTFVIDNAKGFSRAGVERINDIICTYCWAILGSQTQTRTDILGSGTAFDAQKQFLANVEDAINSPLD